MSVYLKKQESRDNILIYYKLNNAYPTMRLQSVGNAFSEFIGGEYAQRVEFHSMGNDLVKSVEFDDIVDVPVLEMDEIEKKYDAIQVDVDDVDLLKNGKKIPIEFLYQPKNMILTLMMDRKDFETLKKKSRFDDAKVKRRMASFVSYLETRLIIADCIESTIINTVQYLLEKSSDPLDIDSFLVSDEVFSATNLDAALCEMFVRQTAAQYEEEMLKNEPIDPKMLS